MRVSQYGGLRERKWVAKAESLAGSVPVDGKVYPLQERGFEVGIVRYEDRWEG